MNRFELEQQILGVWAITSELETLAEAVLEKDISRDQIANILIGMKALYDLKFQKCFDTFESSIKKNIV
jgi:hypothetical protein